MVPAWSTESTEHGGGEQRAQHRAQHRGIERLTGDERSIDVEVTERIDVAPELLRRAAGAFPHREH